MPGIVAPRELLRFHRLEVEEVEVLPEKCGLEFGLKRFNLRVPLFEEAVRLPVQVVVCRRKAINLARESQDLAPGVLQFLLERGHRLLSS